MAIRKSFDPDSLMAWWTRLQPIQAISEIDYEFWIFTSEPFLYQKISMKVYQMSKLGMTPGQIAKSLGVDVKTVKTAIEKG